MKVCFYWLLNKIPHLEIVKYRQNQTISRSLCHTENRASKLSYFLKSLVSFLGCLPQLLPSGLVSGACIKQNSSGLLGDKSGGNICSLCSDVSLGLDCMSTNTHGVIHILGQSITQGARVHSGIPHIAQYYLKFDPLGSPD